MKKWHLIISSVMALLILLLATGACATKPSEAPSRGRVMVNETKLLEGKSGRWQVTLNWYIWEDDFATVNLNMQNIGDKKAWIPKVAAADSAGNQGEALIEGVRTPLPNYKDIWPGVQINGNRIFQLGPFSKAVKLYVYLLGEKEQGIEFSLDR